MVPLLLGLSLELLLAHPAVGEPHDVGDQEGLRAGLRPGDVRGGRADCEGSAVHGGGKLWRHSGPAKGEIFLLHFPLLTLQVSQSALAEQKKQDLCVGVNVSVR